MANWLEKIKLPPALMQKNNLPVQNGQPSTPTPQNLPNATVIYGIGASLLFAASFFLLIGGRWFSSFIVFALGLCLTGFALHLLKHQD
jgi:hypothetical protein